MKLREILISGIIGLSAIVGCSDKPKDRDNSQSQSQAQESPIPETSTFDSNLVQYSILEPNSVLTYDIVKEGYPDWFKQYKVDLDSSLGSFSLLTNSSGASVLHKYIGDGRWEPIESDIDNNAWKNQLKNEMLKKIDEGKVQIEGYVYNPKN
jgi:hypothetical protein